jgi:hypothetical protein
MIDVKNMFRAKGPGEIIAVEFYARTKNIFDLAVYRKVADDSNPCNFKMVPSSKRRIRPEVQNGVNYFLLPKHIDVQEGDHYGFSNVRLATIPYTKMGNDVFNYCGGTKDKENDNFGAYPSQEGVSNREYSIRVYYRLILPAAPSLRGEGPSGPATSCENVETTGFHTLMLGDKEVHAYCDVNRDGHNWLVFQRRAEQTNQLLFNRTWDEYKDGFRDENGHELWLGLDNLAFLTQDKAYKLRVALWAYDDVAEDMRQAHIDYNLFRVAEEAEKYQLTVGEPVDFGAGDAMENANGMYFTTQDRDNDNWPYNNLASVIYHGGWWFNNAPNVHRSANLNGVFYREGERRSDGVVWFTYPPDKYPYSLRRVEMLITPKN